MNIEERSRLDVIEAKVDTILVKLEYTEKEAIDHESRIRAVEKWKLAIPAGLLLAAATVLGAILARQ